MTDNHDETKCAWAVYECHCPTCGYRWVHVAPYGMAPTRCEKCDRVGLVIGKGASKPVRN